MVPDPDWVDPYFMGLPDPDPYLNPYAFIKDWKNLRKKFCIHIFKSKVKKMTYFLCDNIFLFNGHKMAR